MTYVKKDAILMCTGCPGVPARLETKDAKTIDIDNGVIGVSTDKNIAAPAFGTCLIVPTAPRKCNPTLGAWARLKTDVKCKGKPLLLFPNTIPCTFGPGLITMTYAGQVVTRDGASGDKEKEFECDWKGDTHKHKGFKKVFPGEGNTKREDLGEWARPNLMFDSNSTQNKIKYQAFWGDGESSAENYPAQRHHVIPVKSIEKVPALAQNLELLGYNINTETNGIRLPMHDENIFWHDLPRHDGWNNTHKQYNNIIKDEIGKKFDKKWKDFCKDENTENEERDLLDEIEIYIDKLRNKIIQWNSTYFVYEDGGRRDFSFQNAGVAIPAQDKKRKYPFNFTNG